MEILQLKTIEVKLTHLIKIVISLNAFYYFHCRKKKKRKEIAKPTTEQKSKEKQETVQQSRPVIQKTKAQLKFEQMKEEQFKKKIMEKANKTHKQRVEEFNRHLDSLTEHFDVPKVSWTK